MADAQRNFWNDKININNSDTYHSPTSHLRRQSDHLPSVGARQHVLSRRGADHRLTGYMSAIQLNAPSIPWITSMLHATWKILAHTRTMAKHFLRVRFDERKKLGLAAPSIPDGECRRWVNSGEQKWITSGERQGIVPFAWEEGCSRAYINAMSANCRSDDPLRI